MKSLHNIYQVPNENVFSGVIVGELSWMNPCAGLWDWVLHESIFVIFRGTWKHNWHSSLLQWLPPNLTRNIFSEIQWHVPSYNASFVVWGSILQHVWVHLSFVLRQLSPLIDGVQSWIFQSQRRPCAVVGLPTDASLMEVVEQIKILAIYASSNIELSVVVFSNFEIRTTWHDVVYSYLQPAIYGRELNVEPKLSQGVSICQHGSLFIFTRS